MQNVQTPTIQLNTKELTQAYNLAPASWLIGLGSIFFIWHNIYQPFIDIIFLPHLGMMFIIAGIAYVFIRTNTKQFFKAGEKTVWIPLSILAICMLLSAFTGTLSIRDSFADVAIVIMLAGLYFVSKFIGESIFKFYAIAAIIESASIVWYTFSKHIANGGLLSSTNYDIAAGFLIFSLIVSSAKWQKILFPFVLIGVIFSGAAEAIFVLAILAIYYLIRNRKNLNYRLIAITIGLAAIAFILTYNDIWQYKITDRIIAVANGDLLFATGYRATAQGNWNLTMPIRLFGYGLNINRFYIGIPHNIILIIIEQCGILAFLAWFAAWMYATKKTFNSYLKYAYIGFILMGVFDHFIFTQACIWFPMLLGVTYSNSNKGEMEHGINQTLS